MKTVNVFFCANFLLYGIVYTVSGVAELTQYCGAQLTNKITLKLCCCFDLEQIELISTQASHLVYLGSCSTAELPQKDFDFTSAISEGRLSLTD